jgi:hypothetical protein
MLVVSCAAGIKSELAGQADTSAAAVALAADLPRQQADGGESCCSQ